MVLFQAGTINFSSKILRTARRLIQPPIQWVPDDSFSGVNATGAWQDHSSGRATEIIKIGSERITLHRGAVQAFGTACYKYVSVDLFMQLALHMRPVMLSAVACPILQYEYFFTLSNKRHDFWK
jgi:hypothetical protein